MAGFSSDNDLGNTAKPRGLLAPAPLKPSPVYRPRPPWKYAVNLTKELRLLAKRRALDAK